MRLEVLEYYTLIPPSSTALIPLPCVVLEMSAQPIASGSSNNPTANAANIITALGAAFKTREGEPLSGEKIAQLLLQNMGQLSELAKQGKLNQQQIMQVYYKASFKDALS